jgi:hypothetical protein
MRALLVAFLFGSPDPPPECFEALPVPAKMQILYLAVEENLAIPNRETYDLGYFRGVVYVFRRRYNADPLPYPADPVLGWRK